jgi:hypothetical protein
VLGARQQGGILVQYRWERLDRLAWLRRQRTLEERGGLALEGGARILEAALLQVPLHQHCHVVRRDGVDRQHLAAEGVVTQTFPAKYLPALSEWFSALPH